MSFVLAPSRGIRATTSPASISWPSSTDNTASTDIAYWIGLPALLITGSPVLMSATIMEGFKSEPFDAERQSVTIF